MSMEKDVHTLKTIAVAAVVFWVVLFVIGIGSYLWTAYKTRQAEAEDQKAPIKTAALRPSIGK